MASHVEDILLAVGIFKQSLRSTHDERYEELPVNTVIRRA